MTETTKQVSSRRQFLGNTGRIAAATTLAGITVPHVHAAEDNTLAGGADRLRRPGNGCRGQCAGRETRPGAAGRDVRRVRQPVAKQPGNLKNQFGDRVDVPEDRQFVGFDGYRKATDCLKPGDIVISATPPAFRWAHFDYAVKKGCTFSWKSR
jgi:hypothetical protein